MNCEHCGDKVEDSFSKKLDEVLLDIDIKIEPLVVKGVRFADKIVITGRKQAKEAIVQAVLQEIPEDREWDKSEPYDNPDVAQGYNEALDELREKFSND